MKRKNSIALGLLLTATTVLAPSLKAHAAPQIVPYGTVEAELDFTREVKEVFTEDDGVTTAVSLENGNYFSVRTVNFSKGVSKISVKLKAEGAGILVIHKGDQSGESVGTIRYSATDGYKEFSADVTNLADTDYFTFENKVGNCAVDSWKAVPGETQEPETPDTPEEPDTPPVQPPVVEQGAINPYEKVEAENATSDELTNAMVVPSKDKVVINENGKVLVQHVNFSQGVSTINVYAQSSKPMVKLNVYIDDAETPIGTAAVGPSITNATAINVSSNITGSHNVYFVAQGGSVTLDGWQAVAAEGGVEQPPVEEQPVVEPPVGDTVNPYATVEAESAAATDMSNARVTPKKDAVSLTQANSYVAIKNVNFAQGVAEFDANVSASAAGMLEVRLDSATGDKVAAFRLDKNSTITTKTAKALSTVTGTHDVYFVVAAGTGVTLDSWVAKPAEGGVEEPPVVEPPVGDTINPYEKVEAEIATDLTSAMVTPSKDKVVINENGSVTVQNVNFSQGVSSINAYAQSSKPGVSLNVYIDDAATPAGTATVGPSITNATAINVSSAITGVHKVRFEAKGGSVTLDGWQAVASGEEPPVEPPVGDTINPYEKVEAEIATDLTSAMVTPSKDKVVINENGKVLVQNVDFSKGVSSINAYAQSSKPGVSLNVYIDDAETPAGTATVGPSITNATAINVSSAITGVHKVYFEAKGGSVTLDGWQAVAGGGEEPPVVEPPVGDTVNPYATVEAESAAATDMSNARVTPKKDAVSLTQANSYVAIKNVNFANGVSEFSANVSASTAGMLEIRLDSATGDKVAAFRLDQNGTITTKTTKALATVTGTHDVYFVVAAGSGITIDSWTAKAAEGVEQPPVVEPPVGDTINPYEKVEAEIATDLTSAMVAPSKDKVVINENGSVTVQNVNFSQGISSINAYAQSSKPGVSLNVYIDDADAPAGTATVGPSITNATAINVSSAITGVHKVRFEAKGGSVTLDGWQAVASGEEPPVVEPPVGDTVNPYATVEAESAAATDMSNARVTPKKDAVSLTQANSYVAIKNVNFAQGVAEFSANVSASTAGMLEIRLDSATGDKVAAFRLDQNGTITTKTTKALATVTGTHDVYFVVAAGSGITIDSWTAKAAEGVEQPPVVEPPVEGAINPYAKVEAEIATAEQLTNAMIVPSKDKVVINENGYVLVQNIDFSKGVSAFNVYAQSSKPMVSLNVYIDDSQTPAGTVSIGTDITKPTTINVSTDITGVHYVYFEAKGGSVTLDGWQATAAGDQPPVEPPVGDTVNPYATVEAESAAATDMSNARVTPKKDAVSLTQANSYVAYKNVNFAQGVTEFNANVSAASAAMLEVRLDSATGDKVAAFRLSQNSAIETKTTKALANVTGTHDVYFVVTAGTGVTLDSWVAKTSGDQPPVVEPPVEGAINPYAKVEAEIATAEQLTNAMVTPSKDKVVINENGYVLVQNIDFSKGVSAFNVYAQASKPKVNLNVYIDDSKTPAGTVAVGTDITKPVTINVSSDITGVHYVYFEAKGGSVTLDGWQAAAAGEKPPVNPPATNVDPYTSVDATTASILSGALITPSKTAVNITPNGSAGTANVNFTDGVSQFVITASSTSTGKIEVRLNSASGPLLGSATISGDSKEYTITASKNITGKQTIYFVNSGSGVVNVYSWKATAYSEPIVIPDPPVEQTGMDLSYTINSWTDGYQVSFKVTNKSGSTKNSWKVKVKKSDITLTQSWCVNVSQEGDYYVFTPMSWNSTLTNGQTTEFGIIGRGQVGSTINYIVE